MYYYVCNDVILYESIHFWDENTVIHLINIFCGSSTKKILLVICNWLLSSSSESITSNKALCSLSWILMRSCNFQNLNWPFYCCIWSYIVNVWEILSAWNIMFTNSLFQLWMFFVEVLIWYKNTLYDKVHHKVNGVHVVDSFIKNSE